MKQVIVTLAILTLSLSAGAYDKHIRTLGMDSGLSSNYVNSIAQDKDGFLWFATEEGLNMFDGHKFTTFYKSQSQQSITGNELNDIMDDPTEPLLWIATQREGLNAYNYHNNTFLSYRHQGNNPHSIATNDITSIHAAHDGNLWITTYWEGFDYMDKKKQTFTHYNSRNVKGFPKDHIWTLLDNGDGTVLVGHVTGGLSLVDIKARTAHNFRHVPAQPSSIAGNDVYAIAKDKQGRLWIGTGKGLDLFNPKDRTFTHFTDGGRLNRRILHIEQLSDSKLWVCAELYGIAIIDINHIQTEACQGTAPIHYITRDNGRGGLTGESARCLFEDKYKNVWVGMYGEGINFLSRQSPLFGQISYSTIGTPYSLTDKSAMTVCTDSSGRLWAGTDNGEINVFNRDKQRTDIIQAESSVQASIIDGEGKMWFGLFNHGAWLLNGKRLTPLKGMPSHADVRSFHPAPDGLMLIATSQGIYVADRKKAEVLYHYNIGNNLIRSITTSKDGHFWVATFGDGLYELSPEMEILHHYDTDHQFPSNTVNQVFTDSRKRLWAATAEGLVLFTTPQTGKPLHYKVYDTHHGLNNSHIRSIIEDNQGTIWVGTNKGISCMPHDREQFFNYTYKDNIPLGSFLAASVARDADGTLYFGSNNGVSFFSPAQVLKQRQSPPAVITDLVIKNGVNHPDSSIMLHTGKKVSLKYSQNTFTANFSVQNFALAHEVEYAYKIDNLNDQWNIVDGNSVSLSDLSPGTYTLLVKSRFRNQPWSGEVAQATIVINPPYWLSWWAKAAYILAAAALAFALLRGYKRRIRLEYLLKSEKQVREQEQKLNDERLRFFTNITHELRTPLTLILGPLDDLTRDNRLPEEVGRKIQTMLDSARKLYSLISNILEFRKTETASRRLCVGRGNVVAIVREECRKFQELNRNKNLDIRFEASQDIINIYFDKEILDTIVNNLMSNAIKYTPQGTVTVSVNRTTGTDGQKWVEFAVSDTGYGISAQALPHIFDRFYQEHGEHQAPGTGIGLSLVRNLAEIHEGMVSVESQQGKGSIFRFCLNEDNTYAHSPHLEDTSKTTPEGVAEESQMQTEASTPHQRQILLVVEDNKDICRYIADTFRNEFDIITASNGKEGLEKARETLPDIILSDVMMPEMDGNEMCHLLKTDLRTCHIPIVLLTAKDSTTSREEGYQSGADSYITKPFVGSLLKIRIQNLLQQRHILAQSYMANTGNKTEQEEKHDRLQKSMNELDRKFLSKVDECIEAGMMNSDFDLDMLAKTLNMSVSTLYRKMTALTGLSTSEYIRKLRMRKAEKLLIEGKFTIAEVGYRVGINTTPYFRKLFKEEFGMTPTEYLNQLK